MASASDDGTVRLWDTSTGTARQTLEGHSDPVSAVAFSPDGQLVASASDDGTVRLWDASTGTARQTLEDRSGEINTVAFSLDGSSLHTNCGTLLLTSENTPQTQLSSTNVWTIEGPWMTFNTYKVLWLPPHIRPSCSVERKNLFVLGNGSGRVIFIGVGSSLDE